MTVQIGFPGRWIKLDDYPDGLNRGTQRGNGSLIFDAFICNQAAFCFF